MPASHHNSRIVLGATFVLGIILFSANLSVADPPSSAQGDAPRDTRKTKVRQQRFKSLDEAIARAEEELKADYRFDVAALVYAFSTPHERPVRAQTELHSEGGFRPGRISNTEVVLQPVFVFSATRPVEMHIIAPGFEKYVRRVILHPGDLIIWDDIVLNPITERSAASVVGRVRLEDEEEDLEGMVIYIDQEAVTFTDASGYFVANPVRPGKLRVSTRKPGYVGMYTEVKVAPGYEQVCELVGYRQRFAHVRWAYQPDGTRDFSGDIRTGTAVLSSRKLSRVSFAKGFKQVSGYSDFLVTQVKDQLVLRHFDVYTTGKIPASVLIKDMSFDELNEAPESGYGNTEAPLRPGDFYVFRCYDGKHYAMMEVLSITDEPPSPYSQ